MLFGGRVSTGLIHATPGEMKSFRSSADRIALIVAGRRFGALGKCEPAQCERCQEDVTAFDLHKEVQQPSKQGLF